MLTTIVGVKEGLRCCLIWIAGHPAIKKMLSAYDANRDIRATLSDQEEKEILLSPFILLNSCSPTLFSSISPPLPFSFLPIFLPPWWWPGSWVLEEHLRTPDGLPCFSFYPLSKCLHRDCKKRAQISPKKFALLQTSLLIYTILALEDWRPDKTRS